MATLAILAAWSAPARADVSGGALHARSDRDRDMRVFHIATGARLASAPDGTVLVEPTVESTLTVIPHFAVGLELSGGAASLVSGKRTAYNVTPIAEGFYHVNLIEVFGRVGAPVQFRYGGQVPDSKGFAVFGGGGARLRIGDDCPAMKPRFHDSEDEKIPGCWTLGFELRAQYNASGGFLMMPAVLPSNTGIVSGGVTVGLEI